MARELISSLADTTRVFTDGSVLPGGEAGYGFHIGGGQTVSGGLPPGTTVLACELIAIREALHGVEDLALPTGATVSILSDSRGALRCIEGRGDLTRPGVVHSILDSVSSLALKGSHVDFHWISSHVGLAGNERADRAAAAGSAGLSISSLPLRPSPAEVKIQVKHKLWCKWDDEFLDWCGDGWHRTDWFLVLLPWY